MGEHFFPSSILGHVILKNTSISNTDILRCADDSFFSKSSDPVMMMLLTPGEECHLDFFPKSCSNPSLVTIDPPALLQMRAS